MNQTLPWNGPSNNTCVGNTCFHVYDVYDLVLPPMEENALFVTSNMWVTKNQRRGICPSYGSDNTCSEETKMCQHLKSVNNGLQTGVEGSCRTNYSDPKQLWPQIIPKGSYCDVYGWCPTELEMKDKRIINNFGILGVKEFTVFVRMNVNYPKFGYTLDNTAGATSTTEGINLWTLEEMVQASGWNWTEIQNLGVTIAMNAVWNCNFDKGVDACAPTITFVRLDDPLSTLSTGFNFRSVEYLHDELGTRQLTKHYGVRLLVLISGVGSQFDWAALFTAIGAGIGLLSVATLIADFIATNLLQNKMVYRSAKYQEVDVPEEDDEEDEEKSMRRKQSQTGVYQPPTLTSSSSGNGGTLLGGHHVQSDDIGLDENEESWGLARYPIK